MMNHTYLLTEGIWIANGTYSDPNCGVCQVEGKTIISHQKNVWINDGIMKLLLEKPLKFSNRYEVKPFEKEKDLTTWTSYNPAIGVLNGHFMIVHDSILSKYISEDKKYSGYEFLKKIDGTTYENRGYAFQKDKKLSSWAVTLKKIK